MTAILPDDIVLDVQRFTEGKNITDSLIKALSDWLYAKRIEQLDQDLTKEPVHFREGFSADQIRRLQKRI